MRIAQVCPYSLSLPGGVQSQVLSLGRALRDLGHECRILAPCDGPPPDPMVTPLGHSLPTASNGSIAPLAPDPAAALRTISALRNENFDVIHLHEPLAPGPTMTTLLTADAPLVGTFHAAGTRTGYAFAPWLTKRMAKRLRFRIAVSEDARATAERTLGGHYEVLYNGIDTERFAPPAGFEKSEERTILFLGRVEHRKGLSVLIEAMQHLPNDVRLFVAGQGNQSEELQAATAGDPRIVWFGRVSDSERLNLMQQATIYCAPSLEGESFGIVLLEGMAAQTPVVASDLPGYRNVADDGRAAAMVTPGDPVALAATLMRVFDDEELQATLVSNGIIRAEQFSMRELAKTYVALYKAIL